MQIAYITKGVVIELPYKGCKVFVPEVSWKDEILHISLVSYTDLCSCFTPAYNIAQFLILR
jgi:hypothetical protein